MPQQAERTQQVQQAHRIQQLSGCGMLRSPVHAQEPYGSNRAAWEAEVQRPFKAGAPAGRARLLDLLGAPGRGLMIRACKEDVLRLPPLQHKVRHCVALHCEPRMALPCRQRMLEERPMPAP